MNNNFYKSLEDKFRGSRDLIKERLTIYLPFLEVFKNIEQNVNAKMVFFDFSLKMIVLLKQ